MCKNIMEEDLVFKLNKSPGRTIGNIICRNIMFPINVSLFAHLEKHCFGNKICLPGSKNVS